VKEASLTNDMGDAPGLVRGSVVRFRDYPDEEAFKELLQDGREEAQRRRIWRGLPRRCIFTSSTSKRFLLRPFYLRLSSLPVPAGGEKSIGPEYDA